MEGFILEWRAGVYLLAENLSYLPEQESYSNVIGPTWCWVTSVLEFFWTTTFSIHNNFRNL